MKHRKILLIPIYIVLILVAIIYIFPFIYSFLGSLMSYQEIMSYPPKFLPSSPSFSTYRTIFELEFAHTKLFPRWILNSVVISLSVTALNMFFASLAGYAFAKINFKGKNVVFLLFLSTLMIPGFTLLPTQYLIMQKLGWIDTYFALIIPSMCTVFSIFLMRQFYQAIPNDLMDAAKIDGCSPFGVYRRVALPLSKPALSALAIYTFMGSWNGFQAPLFFMHRIEMYTLPLGMSFFKTQQYVFYNQVLAGSIFTILPTLVVFLIFQKYFVKGIAFTGMKF